MNEMLYHINRLRGYSHFLSTLRLRRRQQSDAVGERISYHAFDDLGIPGLFNLAPLIGRYHFPNLRGLRVLDVGCASGFFSRYFAQQGADVVGVDIDTTAATKIRRVSEPKWIISDSNAFAIPFENDFDLVFCGSLLLHVFDPVRLIEILHRCLKPGGRFVLCTAALPSRRPEMRLYARETIRSETSTDDALWWISEKAQVNMLRNVGFNTTKKVDSFVLHSTRFACEQGYYCSLRHNVYQACK